MGRQPTNSTVEWHIHSVQRKCMLLKTIYSSNQKKSLEKFRRQCKRPCLQRGEEESPRRGGVVVEECLRHSSDLETCGDWQGSLEKKQCCRSRIKIHSRGEKEQNPHCRKLNRWPGYELEKLSRNAKQMRIYKNIRYKPSSWNWRRH